MLCKRFTFSVLDKTGESYHAGLDAINQRKRNHIALQLGWQAKVAIQGLGRSHRSNQKQPPRYLLLSTNIAGEKRFTSTIARRLDNLGAITKGQRQAGSQNLYQETDNLESRYARKGLELFINQLKEGKISTCDFDQFIAWTHLKITPEAPVPKIQQFLNRIMALPFERQNALFGEFDRLHQAVIENAKESGTYEVGVETLRALRFQEIDRTVLFESEGGSQTVARKIQRCDPTRKLSFLQVQDLLAKRQGWFAQNGVSGNIAAITPTTLSIDEQGNTYERLKITAPDGSTRTLKTADYQSSSWGQLSTDQAQFLWEEAISQIPDETCSEFYLITGLLLPIWDKLEIEGNFKVYRLSLASGESILGRLVDPQHFNLIYQRFKPASASLTCDEIYHQVVEQRIAFPLWDNTFLRLSHVGGSDRLEITSVYDSDLIHRLQQLGCFTERINWQTRVFLPIEAKQSIPIIKSLLV